MEEIKTKRINGYLDLDSYFFKKLGRKYTKLEDLYINGLIDYEPRSSGNTFWILSSNNHNKLALYKENNYQSGSYAELISEEIANVLKIPVAHYDLATFNGKEGVVSYNFDKENNYLSGFDIIADFYEKNLEDDKERSELYGIDYYKDTIDDVSDKLNNLENVWSILEERLKGQPRKQYIVSSIINGLVGKLIFDILTVNIDGHSENWGIIENKLSPLFDNSRILNMHRDIFKDKANLEDKRLLLSIDNSNIRKPLEVLDCFLKISSEEYKNMIIDKVNKLENNIDLIPTIIEKRTEHEMPREIKEYFLTTMHSHLDKVNEVINKSNKGTKK